MKKIGEVLANKEEKNGKKTERDELLSYFFVRLEPHWTKGKLSKRFFGIKVSHLKTPDLYYLKSICDDAERRGVPFHKMFWSSLKVK